jgi:superoxide dismutase, Cu-Zn family
MKHVQIKRMLQFLLITASSLAIISCGGSSSTNNTGDTSSSTATDTSVTQATTATHAEAIISGTKADTTVDGKASFDSDSGKVKLMLELTIPKMANKTVAVHIHEHPDCGDNGNASHGHWNPTHVQHGKWGVGSFHLGDIGNVKLDAQGKGTLEMNTDLWTLGSDTTSSVLNRAIIVHSGKDDYKSQPSGNAGSRIGCGIIKQ